MGMRKMVSSDKEKKKQNRKKLNKGGKPMKCLECKSDHINKNGHLSGLFHSQGSRKMVDS